MLYMPVGNGILAPPDHKKLWNFNPFFFLNRFMQLYLFSGNCSRTEARWSIQFQWYMGSSLQQAHVW